MITIILLHPSQDIPLQSWSFDQEESITIGRSTDNNIVVYSAVVSRKHLELRKTENQWSGINHGANGTYVNGEKVNQVMLEDGMILRLADTGPKLQIKIGIADPQALQKTQKKKASSSNNHVDTFIREL